jgi:hypothetical protein
VARFKWSHIDYLAALGGEVELHSVWSGHGHAEAPGRGQREGLQLESVGALATEGSAAVRAALREQIRRVQPDLVHVMYYRHEELTLLLRELLPDTALVWECRDPLTTLEVARRGSPAWRTEAAALQAADGHVLVSEALREYLERSHGSPLGGALIVPHAFAARLAGPVAEKLSAVDGRTHIALVGTAVHDRHSGRYYVDIIRRLVRLGFVVHSHFHELDGISLDPYRRLAEELDDYHFHPAVSFRAGHQLSQITSRYDLMGVFHELDARRHNESATLAVCMPTKAVSGWLHGAIPTVTFANYGGLVEPIERLGIGFVAADWPAVGRLVGAWDQIGRATAACLAHRLEFTHEHQARRVAAYYGQVLAGS